MGSILSDGLKELAVLAVGTLRGVIPWKGQRECKGPGVGGCPGSQEQGGRCVLGRKFPEWTAHGDKAVRPGHREPRLQTEGGPSEGRRTLGDPPLCHSSVLRLSSAQPRNPFASLVPSSQQEGTELLRFWSHHGYRPPGAIGSLF